MKALDLTDRRFHNLLVLHRVGSSRDGRSLWLCRCDCGVEKSFTSSHLTRKSDPVKSCGCKRITRGSDHPQWSGVGEISGGWWCSHVTRERSQTARAKVPVTVTMEYAWELFLTQERKCALSGLDIVIGSNGFGTASIDRIDSSRGYEEGNIQWVHKHINFMKRTYSVDYFVDLCCKVANHTGGVCPIK